MNLLNKKKPRILTPTELDALRLKVESRKTEAELRNQQFEIESEFKKFDKKFNFEPEKLKKWLLIVVVGIFLSIIIFKVIGKFI